MKLGVWDEPVLRGFVLHHTTQHGEGLRELIDGHIALLAFSPRALGASGGTPAAEEPADEDGLGTGSGCLYASRTA